MIALWLAACVEGPPNQLEGSLTRVFDLGFDATRARLYDTELSVEYVDEARSGRVAVRLTLRDPQAIEPGRFDLVVRGSVGLADEVDGQLPPLSEGVMELLDYRSDWLVGTFRATFEAPDETRLLLTGAFDASIEVVDAP